jgi:adenylate cyclase
MKTAQPERRFAAILVADVVGYSRLIEADEAGTLAAMKHLRHSLLEPLLAEHHGRIVNLMGDGFIAEFAFVVDAVACAAAVQTRIAARDEPASSESRLVLRIGVNVGDVVVEGDDLLGHEVNVAARLEKLCPPGGVLISSTAHDQLQGKLDVRFEIAGEQRLKNIARPCWVYQMAGLKGVAQIVSSSSLDGRPSVAVLQFVSDVKQRDLSYGVTDAIVSELSRYHSLHITSGNFSFRSRSSSMDKGAVGRRLGARFLVAGRIRRSGDALHLAAELRETTTNHILWAERYERDLEEIFLVQEELARSIAATVEGRIAASAVELAR